MNPLTARFLNMYHDLDPRDRRHAIWVLSPDVYAELDREYMSTPFPSAELVEVGKTPPPERPAMIFGIEVWVRYDLPPDTAILNIDTPTDRAIARARASGTVVNIVQAQPVVVDWSLPAPEVTLRALVRKWIGKVHR